ncbi:MAG: hypothetical protein ACAI34_12535 [Verrucomicrobium sp.]
MILPTTSEATGGVCMPCKDGRNEMTLALRANDKCRWKDDSVRALWRSLAARVDKAKAGAGYSELNPAEQRYYSLTAFDSVVHIAGFQRYFIHTSSAHYEEVMHGLLEVRAFDTVAMLGEAKYLLFGDTEVPRTCIERLSAIGIFPNSGTEDHPSNLRLKELDRLHRLDPDQLLKKLAVYAEEQGLLRPFKMALSASSMA